MKVRIGYSDGHHWMEEYTIDHEKAGLSGVEVSIAKWQAYTAFQKQARYWDEFMLNLGNEQYAQDHKEGAA